MFNQPIEGREMKPHNRNSNGSTPGESTRAVDRALNILLCFSHNSPALTLTQIAERVDINKSTVHRLLATLEMKSFVERDPASGAYRPGIRLLQMAYLTLEQNGIRRQAAPHLRRLWEQYRETVDLAVLDDTDVVYLDVMESPQRVKLAAAIGQRLAACCTASGKALLAFGDEATMQKIAAQGLRPFTERTIVSPEAFLEDLRNVRTRGYAITEEEFEVGINAVAAPVFDAAGHPIATIAVAGPAFRLPYQRLLEIGPTIMTVTRELSQEMAVGAAGTGAVPTA
jgi:IclR family KDG regulon transcriptional repressor